MNTFNFETVKYLNHLGQGTFIDSITNFISNIPFIIILWSVLALLALAFDKKNGKIVFIAVILSLIFHFIVSEGIFKYLLKDVLGVTRPYLEYPNDIIPIGKQFIDSSFPSSHMASTIAVLTVFTYYYGKIWPASLTFILFMAFARMHNGMHYPTDVLVGTFLGLGYGLLAAYLAELIREKWFTKKITSL
jgi:undecaprenyl-diphosphatase